MGRSLARPRHPDAVVLNRQSDVPRINAKANGDGLRSSVLGSVRDGLLSDAVQVDAALGIVEQVGVGSVRVDERAGEAKEAFGVASQALKRAAQSTLFEFDRDKPARQASGVAVGLADQVADLAHVLGFVVVRPR